jgi:hypothetical protein
LKLLSFNIAFETCSCSVAVSKSCRAVALPLSIAATVQRSTALPFSIIAAIKCPPAAAIERHLHLIVVSSSLPLLPCYRLVIVHLHCHQTPPPPSSPLPTTTVEHHLLVIVCPHCLLIVVSVVAVVVCHRRHAATLPSSITTAIKGRYMPLPP